MVKNTKEIETVACDLCLKSDDRSHFMNGMPVDDKVRHFKEDYRDEKYGILKHIDMDLHPSCFENLKNSYITQAKLDHLASESNEVCPMCKQKVKFGDLPESEKNGDGHVSKCANCVRREAQEKRMKDAENERYSRAWSTVHQYHLNLLWDPDVQDVLARDERFKNWIREIVKNK